MSNYLVDGADFTSIANAIRTKGGTSAQLAFPAGFVSAIGAIPTGGGGGIEVLDTIAVAEPVNAIKIDYDPAWSALDLIIIEVDAQTTPGDWVYLGFDTISPLVYLVGNYADHWTTILSKKSSGSWVSRFTKQTGQAAVYNGFPGYLYLKCYAASSNFASGTTIRIWGGNIT